MNEPARVLFLASEADPLIKVGGLGDVAGSLPPALRRLEEPCSLDVRVVIPFHGGIQQRLPRLELAAEFLVPSRGGALQAQAYYTEPNGVPTYLIGGPDIQPDDPVYGPDNIQTGRKYVFFSLAALELARALNWPPHILHANDWHTALSIYSLQLRKDPAGTFKGTRSILSVHNLPFLGDGAAPSLEDFMIPASKDPRLPVWARVFPLPLGLLSADRIVAVSPTYAAEIQTPAFGSGLQDFLRDRADALTGILNGIDMDHWDPEKDLAIDQVISIDALDGRRRNKSALQQELGLPIQADVPLLVFIGRMDQQKGIDIAVDGLRMLADDRWQAIFLGTGSAVLESAVRSLEVQFPERVRAALRFDGQLARSMYAGGDVLMMPSRYEPCGLAQMIAMRYGCLPLARATGGLKDTIIDFEDAGGTGFLFSDAAPEDFAAAARRALASFRDGDGWRSAQQRAMRQDFSWTRSARAYADLYCRLIAENSHRKQD